MTDFYTAPDVQPALGSDHAANLRTEFNALRAQVAAIRAAFVATTAKLDADAGVTDTDYATNDPAADGSNDLTAP